MMKIIKRIFSCKKIYYLLLLALTILAISFFSLFFTQGELIVEFKDIVPERLIIDGPLAELSWEFDISSKRSIVISPLPYGVYHLIFTFSGLEIEFIVCHTNNWQKELLVIEINDDFAGSVSLFVEDKLEEELQIGKDSFGIIHKMNWGI